MPSFILVRPTVWPQYTNITDRQTGQTVQDRQDRQRSYSIQQTVLQNGRPKLDALGYSSVAESLGIYTVSSTTSMQSAPEGADFGEITQNKGHGAGQGHSRSPISVPIESHVRFL